MQSRPDGRLQSPVGEAGKVAWGGPLVNPAHLVAGDVVGAAPAAWKAAVRC